LQELYSAIPQGCQEFATGLGRIILSSALKNLWAANTMPSGMRIRLKDVAQALNLSISTVNAALRNRSDISEVTRKRVVDKVKELNYRPNWVARSLVTQRTQVLGVVVPDLSRSFFTEVITGIDMVASAAGYHLVLTNTGEDPRREDDEIATLISKQVDGLVIASAHEPSDNTVWQNLSRMGVPFVLVDRVFSNAPFVGVDDERIGFLATTHLVEQGYQHIAHLRVPYLSTGIGRHRGYLKALRKHGIRARRDHVVDAQFHNEASGYEGTKILLQRSPRPDAIFAASDPIAIGAMHALLEEGLQIPLDCGLIGVGQVRYGEHLKVPLSTVDQHRVEIGKLAAKALLDLVSGQKPPTRPILIEPTLIVRESSRRRAHTPTRARRPPTKRRAAGA
jgi:LacI family transcriptional regulator